MSGYTEAEKKGIEAFGREMKARLMKEREALRKWRFMMVMKSKPGSARLARGKAVSPDTRIWPGPKSIKPKTRKGRRG